MEIRLLRYFWAVAQEGNISRAARFLNDKGAHSRDFSHESAPVGLETQHVFSV